MNKFEKLDETTGQLTDFNSYRTQIKQNAMDQAFQKIKAYASQSDELIAQAVLGIDDLLKTINLMGNRLSELYSLHFPELVESLSNQVQLL